MTGRKSWVLVMLVVFNMLSGSLVVASPQPQNTQVLVSIHPVALLIKSAWPELQVATLMRANQSPHDFALKPSHRQIIAKAEHLIWLGNDMEPYLGKVIQYHKGALDLSDVFAEHLDHASEHHEEHRQAEHDGHDHGGIDPHIWLNPESLPIILDKVGVQLSLPKPTVFLDKLAKWQQDAHQHLAQHAAGFISFHDAFHYWIEYFGLKQTAVLALNPEQPIGTRHLVEVRQLLQAGNVSCLFVEPQFKASIVDKLQRGTQVPVVKIDPLASQFPVNSGQFLEFYEYLQRQFIRCLNPN